MLNYRNNPPTIEKGYDVVGPTFRGDLATSNPKYVSALFSEPIAESSTSASAVLVDMAKQADGTTRTGWIKGGVYVRIKATQACHIAQQLTNTTSGGQHVTTTLGQPMDAGEEIELMFDEDYRYLEYIWDGTAGTLVHYNRQRPNVSNLALSDT